MGGCHGKNARELPSYRVLVAGLEGAGKEVILEKIREEDATLATKCEGRVEVVMGRDHFACYKALDLPSEGTQWDQELVEEMASADVWVFVVDVTSGTFELADERKALARLFSLDARRDKKRVLLVFANKLDESRMDENVLCIALGLSDPGTRKVKVIAYSASCPDKVFYDALAWLKNTHKRQWSAPIVSERNLATVK
mmetsp:Transcript_17098/g.51023  ORF Transcript_17098/g.51023 Transcript_17098/m.51023 type:complete len:198 (+) Transcript_17098:153-746(+)